MARMDSESIYDFVIVGGGTASLVVATRLSENPKHNVLVLEAGSDHSADPRVQIPAHFDTLKDTELDWKFKSQPQVWASNYLIISSSFTNDVQANPWREND